MIQKKLDRIFYPDERLQCVTDGLLFAVRKRDYLDIVAGRASPMSSEAGGYDTIITMDMAGPSSAVAKVECAIPPGYFKDLLTMVKLNGEWQIINKTYHYITHG